MQDSPAAVHEHSCGAVVVQPTALFRHRHVRLEGLLQTPRCDYIRVSVFLCLSFARSALPHMRRFIHLLEQLVFPSSLHVQRM